MSADSKEIIKDPTTHGGREEPILHLEVDLYRNSSVFNGLQVPKTLTLKAGKADAIDQDFSEIMRWPVYWERFLSAFKANPVSVLHIDDYILSLLTWHEDKMKAFFEILKTKKIEELIIGESSQVCIFMFEFIPNFWKMLCSWLEQNPHLRILKINGPFFFATLTLYEKTQDIISDDEWKAFHDIIQKKGLYEFSFTCSEQTKEWIKILRRLQLIELVRDTDANVNKRKGFITAACHLKVRKRQKADECPIFPAPIVRKILSYVASPQNEAKENNSAQASASDLVSGWQNYNYLYSLYKKDFLRTELRLFTHGSIDRTKSRYDWDKPHLNFCETARQQEVFGLMINTQNGFDRLNRALQASNTITTITIPDRSFIYYLSLGNKKVENIPQKFLQLLTETKIPNLIIRGMVDNHGFRDNKKYFKEFFTTFSKWVYENKSLKSLAIESNEIQGMCCNLEMEDDLQKLLEHVNGKRCTNALS